MIGGKKKPMAVLLATLVFCVLLFPLFVPEGRVDVVDGTAAQKHCIRQSDDTAETGAYSTFFVTENVRLPAGGGLLRIQRMKSQFFWLSVLYSFSLILSMLLYLWNRLKQRCVFGFDTCLHPPVHFLLELAVRQEKDGKKRISIPVFE